MYNFPHTTYPSGWYQIGWTGQFAVGAAVSLRYFDTNLVCYRGESGQLHVSDAFCPHFGAHLGHGGTVEGDCIRCPFHGWKWGPDGRNVEIPYSRPDKMNLRLRQWDVAEIDGLALLWYGAEGEPPTWPRPSFLPERTSMPADFWPVYPDCADTWTNLRFPPQVMAENSGDAAHFRYVHGAAEVPEIVGYEHGEHWFRTRFSVRYGGNRPSTWATPNGPVDGRMTTIMHGIGIAAGIIESFDTVYTLATTTPIDLHTSDHRATVWVPRTRGDGSPLDERIRDRWATQQRTQHAADLPVWENMSYIARPPFAQAEAKAFRTLRRWIEGRYPRPRDEPAPSPVLTAGSGGS
jgi:nitrite reductase/ring-hydroxylating ferredoxin subunit